MQHVEDVMMKANVSNNHTNMLLTTPKPAEELFIVETKNFWSLFTYFYLFIFITGVLGNFWALVMVSRKARQRLYGGHGEFSKKNFFFNFDKKIVEIFHKFLKNKFQLQ